MTEPLNLDLNLDAQGYIDQAGQALAVTQQLDGGLRGLAVTTAGMQRVWGAASPSREHVAMMTAYAGAAAAAQYQLSGLQATQTVTHQSTQQLASGMRQLARDIPIGNQQAQALVKTIDQLGIVGDRSVQKIVQISNTIAKLQQANMGTNALLLGPGMVQLERTFGDQGVDPKRIQATADSLTSVSKEAGAGAQSVLDLSNAIGPLAQASGIGKTATLGISASLARIGQDGYTAANAVNTLLLGINRAVKEGSPDLARYANIVGGISPEQFRTQFQQNPAQMLSRLTTSLARNTPDTQSQLEGLGLDGIRTQRVLQALIASGGLQPAIASATAAYGSGSTNRAAAAASQGVVDNFTRVASSSAQLAEALGEPVLGPLDKFSKAVATVTGGIAGTAQGLMNNRVVKDLATAGVIGGGAALLGARILPGLGIGGLALQAATSSPVRAYAAGIALERSGGDIEAALGTRLGRFGRPVLERYDANEGSLIYQRRSMLTGRPIEAGRATQAAMTAGMGFGQARGPYERIAQRFSLPRRIFSGVMTPIAAAAEAYNRGVAEQAQAARFNMQGMGIRSGGDLGGGIEAESPAMARGAYQRFFQGIYSAGRGPGGVGNVGSTGWVDDVRASFRQLKHEIDPTTTALRPMRMAAQAFGTSMLEQGRLAGSAAIGGIRGVGSGLLGALGGPWGLGITAAVGLGGYALQQNAQGRAERAAIAASQYGDSNTATLDKFNEAIGHATQNTTTFADAAAAAASKVSGAATGDIGLKFQTRASNQQVAAQINALSSTGLDTSQISAARSALAKQGFSPDRVDQIMRIVTSNNPQGVQGGGGGQTLQQLVHQAADINVNFHHAIDQNRIGPGVYYDHAPGQGFTLKGSARALNTQVAENLSQRLQNQTTTYGAAYARSQNLSDINQVMMTAAKSGNEALVNELGDQLARSQGLVPDGVSIPRITSDDIKRYGGYTQALQAKSKQFRAQMANWARQGISINGVTTGQVQLSPLGVTARQNMAGYLASYYDNRNAPTASTYGPFTPDANARRQTLQFAQQPENLQRQNVAVDAQIQAAMKSGHSLEDLAVEASKAAGNIGDTSSAAYKLSQALTQEAQFRLQGQALFQTPAQSFASQFQLNAGLAGQNQNTEQGQANRQQGRQGLLTQLQQVQQMMQAYLANQIQFQVQSGRAAEDFATSQGRAWQDYEVSRARAEEDYQRSSSRAWQDYYTQLGREERDFNISMERGQQDFLISRGRAIRDFNIQLGRQIQDSAQALYDPYKRIQTQAVWDGRDLLTNLAEQNQQVARQNQQLQQARGMGLSNTAIQLLGLNDPNNAQQLSKLINDMLTDPKLVAQLNATAKSRQGLGSILVTDPSNKDIARAKEDFQRQLSDMEADYSKSVLRARQDMARQVADQEHDFGLSMARMEQDYQTQLVRADQDMEKAVGRAQYDFNLSMKRMQEDVNLANEQITTNLTDLWNQTMDVMKGKSADVNKLMHNGLQDTIKFLTDKNNIASINSAYKNLFPYDLSKVFGTGGGTGGGNPGQSPTTALSGSIFGPWPVLNPVISQQYGNRNGRDSGGHPGIDLAEKPGTPIIDELAGVVIQSGWNDGYGNSLTIDHGNGRTSLYGHMVNAPNWKVGQIIKPGQQIGQVGSTGNSTGPHLHFELRQNGRTVDPNTAWPIWRGSGGVESISGLFGLPSLGPWGALIEGAFYQMTNGTMTGASGRVLPGSLPPVGDLQKYAMQLLQRRGWGNQWASFNSIVNAEDASWNPTAVNPQSGAWGIPQALPGDKMAIEGSDWRTNGRTQLRWMINDYIPHQSSHFSTPDEAWAFHQRMGWYANGAIFNGPRVIGVGESGPEAVIPLDQRGASMMAQAMQNVMTTHELRQLSTSSYSSPVTYHTESITLDQRQIVEHVEVQAQDPDEMGRKLAAKQRRQNLTGVKR